MTTTIAWSSGSYHCNSGPWIWSPVKVYLRIDVGESMGICLRSVFECFDRSQNARFFTIWRRWMSYFKTYRVTVPSSDMENIVFYWHSIYNVNCSVIDLWQVMICIIRGDFFNGVGCWEKKYRVNGSSRQWVDGRTGGKTRMVNKSFWPEGRNVKNIRRFIIMYIPYPTTPWDWFHNKAWTDWLLIWLKCHTGSTKENTFNINIF